METALPSSRARTLPPWASRFLRLPGNMRGPRGLPAGLHVGTDGPAPGPACHDRHGEGSGACEGTGTQRLGSALGSLNLILPLEIEVATDDSEAISSSEGQE